MKICILIPICNIDAFYTKYFMSIDALKIIDSWSFKTRMKINVFKTDRYVTKYLSLQSFYGVAYY